MDEKVNFIDGSTLTHVNRDFDGLSLPCWDVTLKKYVVVDIDEFRDHLMQIVAGELVINAGYIERLAGITDRSDINSDTTTDSADVKVYYSTVKKKCVFEAAGVLYATHTSLQDKYNDEVHQTVRQDKIYLMPDMTLYAYNKGMLVKLYDFKPTQSLGNAADKIPSEKAVYDALVESRKTSDTSYLKMNSEGKAIPTSTDGMFADSSQIKGKSGKSVEEELDDKVSAGNLCKINGKSLINGGKNIEVSGGNGGSQFGKNAIVLDNLIKEVVFGNTLSEQTGSQMSHPAYVTTDFIALSVHKEIKISCNNAFICAFYRLKSFDSFVSIEKGTGDKVVSIPSGANFIKVAFTRNDMTQENVKINFPEVENEEVILPGVKNFAPLPIRDIHENQFMNKDGSLETYTGMGVHVHDVSSVSDVYLTGGGNFNNKVAFVWVKNAQGEIMWSFDHISNSSNMLENFHLVLPEGAKELWVYKGIKVSLVKHQNDINFDLYQKNSDMNKKLSVLDGNIKKIDERVKSIEESASPTPTPQPTINPLNHWRGTKIVWVGASVPAGETTEEDAASTGGTGAHMKDPYPEQVGKMLQCKMVNMSQGGLSLLSMRLPDGRWVNAHDWGCSLSLDNTEVKAAGTKFTWSYEDVILANKDADLFVFDTEPNNAPETGKFPDADKDILDQFDFANWAWRDGSDFKEHRDNYQGAMLFILNKLYEANRYARIVFVREFLPFTPKAWGKEFQTANQAKHLAEELHVPYIELQKKLQYNAYNRYEYIIEPEIPHWSHLYSKTHAIIAKILAHELLRIA